jgi:hypothetical protein
MAMRTGRLFPASVPTHWVSSSGIAYTCLPLRDTGIPDSCQRWATAGVCPRNWAIAFQPSSRPDSPFDFGSGLDFVFGTVLPLLKGSFVARRTDELPSLMIEPSTLTRTLKLALVAVKQSLEDRLGIRGPTERAHGGLEFRPHRVQTTTTGVARSHFTTLRFRLGGRRIFSTMEPKVCLSGLTLIPALRSPSAHRCTQPACHRRPCLATIGDFACSFRSSPFAVTAARMPTPQASTPSGFPHAIQYAGCK